MEQNQVEVEVLMQVATSQYGTLNAGDRLRTNPAFAAHLVNDCGAAAYVDRAASDARPDGAHTPDGLTPVIGVQTSAQDAERAAMALLTDAVSGAASSAGEEAAGELVDAQTLAMDVQGEAQAGAKVATAPARKRASTSPKEG